MSDEMDKKEREAYLGALQDLIDYFDESVGRADVVYALEDLASQVGEGRLV